MPCYPQVEFWMQDLMYEDDLPHFRLGGFAQHMRAVPDGFFDALTLHNSFARIYFDPVAATPSLLRGYDQGAELIPVRGFANQEHARCYDPATLQQRLISRVPPSLEATIVEFSGGESISPEMYPDFALVLHRPESVFRGS